MFWGFIELNRSISSCTSFIFIKYKLFLLINKIICMGKVDSLFLPEKKLHVTENKSSSRELR